MTLIFVAFKTVLVPDLLAAAEAAIVPPANYKDPDKIAAYVEQARAVLAADCLAQPYTATFEAVELQRYGPPVPGGDPDRARWVAAPGRGPVAPRVRDWLLRNSLPGDFPHALHPRRAYAGQVRVAAPAAGEPAARVSIRVADPAPPPVFVGADVRTFLDVLAADCSLPANQPTDPAQNKILPLSAWAAGNNYRDIQDLVMPARHKRLTWDVVLRARDLRAAFPDWPGPGRDVAADLNVWLALAAQLALTAAEEAK